MRHVRVISKHKDVVINMDTTYWGRGFGLMVMKDAFRNKILWYKFVRHETIADYLEGITWLRDNNFKIHGIVCDGMRGLFYELRQYRVQMCQFHQMMIVRRYLTLKPELPAAIELLEISNMIARTDKNSLSVCWMVGLTGGKTSLKNAVWTRKLAGHHIHINVLGVLF